MILQRILTKMARGILWTAKDLGVSKETKGLQEVMVSTVGI
jgi:hypothetical protein